MPVDPIPHDELEPFAAPGRNVEKHEQRRYSALFNEIGGDPMIEDLVDEADTALWNSRRPWRAAKTVYLSAIPTAIGSHVPIKDVADAYFEVSAAAAQSPEATTPEMVGLFGPFAVGAFVLGYGKVQQTKAEGAVNDLADSMRSFTDYRVIEPYEVGRFERNDDIEQLLMDAGTVRAEPRIAELYMDDDERWVNESGEAVELYRDVLDELATVHTEGVADETAQGVNLYGSGFLEPFFEEDEAVQRAADIESSGVAQLLRTAETSSNVDGDNPVLTSDYVFRLELVYNGQTVAKFDGTCTEEATELGEPLIESDDIPSSGRHSSLSFSKVMSTYEELGEDLGMEFDEDDYTVNMFDQGGIPRHLYDTVETVGRTAYGTAKAFYGMGKAIGRAVDIRGATR